MADVSKQDIDEDDAYEKFRQEKIDSGECMSCNRAHEPDSPYCAECALDVEREHGTCTDPHELKEIEAEMDPDKFTSEELL